MRKYNPDDEMLAGFTATDGTMEFYSRINAISRPHFRVVDIGAGRGAWYYEDKCEYRRKLRSIKGKVSEFICADIDKVVLNNPTSDRNIVIEGNRIPIEDNSVDLIISDYVLEHITDVETFMHQVARILKPGGYFCARTPHRMNYVSFFARLIRNKNHARYLSSVQPNRKAEDVFPTSYKLNSLRKITNVFKSWDNFTYLYTSEPRYYFGSKVIYRLFYYLHKFAPVALTGNVFIFVRKPDKF